MLFDPRIHKRKTRPSRVYQLSWSVYIERPVEDVFKFCLDGASFQKIVPNRVEKAKDTDETIVQHNHVYPFRQWTLGIPMRWTMHVVEFVPNEKFVDELMEGPMRYVRHTHLFERQGTGTRYADILEYRPFLGPLLHHLFVKQQINSTFLHRQKEMKRLLEAAA
jgi:ligand-binding SRPBCC domain-containing protein